MKLNIITIKSFGCVFVKYKGLQYTLCKDEFISQKGVHIYQYQLKTISTNQKHVK